MTELTDLLEEQFRFYRCKPFNDLRALIGKDTCTKLVGPNGVMYELRVVVDDSELPNGIAVTGILSKADGIMADESDIPVQISFYLDSNDNFIELG